MRLSELEIGDWVTYICDQVQIADIRENVSFYIYDDSYVQTLNRRNAETGFIPLLITEHFLQMNGFTLYKGKWSVILKDNAPSSMVVFIEYDMEERILKIDTMLNEEQVPDCCRIICRHVHVMQHIMRLCGLEDFANHLTITDRDL